jgi:hypothetical protein
MIRERILNEDGQFVQIGVEPKKDPLKDALKKIEELEKLVKSLTKERNLAIESLSKAERTVENLAKTNDELHTKLKEKGSSKKKKKVTIDSKKE